ncbi:MAG TPA: HAMP domain-containing sensor histidine kinase [Gemmatimonadaceae bacterium]|nr:HAMP domain-containing sensor histidine kinase [Gemmatimonadaceae bacterium]
MTRTPRSRMSLARQLSLMTGAVIALSLMIVLAVAYEALTRSALSGAAQGLDRATRQLASLGETGIRQTRVRYTTATRDPAIRRALLLAGKGSQGAAAVPSASSDSIVKAARNVLSQLVLPTDSGLPIELWSANGNRIAYIGEEQAKIPESAGRPLGEPRVPRTGIDEVRNTDSLQFGRLYASGGRSYFWMVQPIRDGSKAIGYFAQQRFIAVNPQAGRSIRALSGEGISAYYHNTDGSVWTTVAGAPVSPPQRSPNDSAHAVRDADKLLIAEAPVLGTPFVVAMESRVSDVLAPPRATLRELLIVAVALLIAGMAAALYIGGRVAKPIVAIADGAEAIARGQYETRVATSGQAEIARLAGSFNHMANEVAVAQRALEQKSEDALAANRAKSEFLATMSHELRTPLNAIAGYTELLEMGLRGPLTDAQRRDLARIRTSGQHLLGLISGVLDLSRIERGQLTYSFVPIAIDPFLADLDALISPQASAKSLTLEYLPSERDLTLIADREKLRQVVLNLLSNAIRFTPAGGRITLSASAAGDSRVTVRVQDTGPGIPEARREQVFEPFVQLDRSLTQPQEGLGLGLAISRDLARGMNGELTLDNSATQGANFVLTLPRGSTETVRDFKTSAEMPTVGSA